MTIEGALAQRVRASEDFQQIAGDRLYPVLLPDSCHDANHAAATYQLISTTPLYALDGRVNFTECRIEFDAWAPSYFEAKSLMAAIVDALDDYSDRLSSGMQIYGVQVATAGDGPFESGGHLYRVTADFKVQFSK